VQTLQTQAVSTVAEQSQPTVATLQLQSSWQPPGVVARGRMAFEGTTWPSAAMM
jgi:hypothetical protein